jgi:hypothetical protein
MKMRIKVMLIAMVILLGFGGLAQAADTSMKDMYLIVSKYAKSNANRVEFEKAMGNAEAEFDLFKDSKVAKKNPEFTEHLAKAMKSIKQAGFLTFVVPGSQGGIQERDVAWKTTERELKAAKEYLK